MATLLYHLGRFSARRPWTVVIAWIVLLGVVTGAAVGLHKPLTSEMTVEGAPFQVTLQKLQRELPPPRAATARWCCAATTAPSPPRRRPRSPRP
ncbi:hypothetical protein [Arsenicicoccus piscis]|uniref:Membrane transport protein MMPL domain-containing protein n=1 Tax=Arsenicicoccus piscis TaxID=673954 RepID=A0ABQ6HK28_9MICO|nr:hypothetical protein [Arsenicicoccus piscis]GMA18778.1 hypothetical protein GCM10025862_07990 [Arsenicicoccus piscis]